MKKKSATTKSRNTSAAETKAVKKKPAKTKTAKTKTAKTKTAKKPTEHPKSAIVKRRADSILHAFVQEDRTVYAQRRDAMQIQTVFGEIDENTDPYDKEKQPENEAQLHRFALDLLHGPTTIGPRITGGSLKLLWRNFEIAFGTGWQEKQKIANCLFGLKHPDRQGLLLSHDGVIGIGPGGSAFHVALQFAWRMRARFELGADYFNGCQIAIHTASFEVARLLGPLALDETIQVFLQGTNVSRSASKERPRP